MRVAAVQMSSGADMQRNVDDALALIERAAATGARLVMLPETWTCMGTVTQKVEAAVPIPGHITDRLAEAARRHRIYLHCGSMYERAAAEPRVYNTTALLGPDGDLIARYRKIHLYDVSIGEDVVSQESATVAPGDEQVVVGIDGIRLGLTICYDLRFPELYRMLALEGADMVAVPAAFHAFTGKDHWEVLLRARAIENQFFVVAPNAWGRHPDGWQSYGRSTIVDPWGTVLATAPDGVGIAVADCDLEAMKRVRHDLPSLANRRPAAYRWTHDAALVS
jgi:predicted amidohydrolase